MTDVATDAEERLAQIQRMQEETRKFVSEQHKLQAESAKLAAENGKLSAEAIKLAFEAAKFSRDRDLAPWQIAVGGMAAGAALVGATAAVIKVFG